MRSISTAHNQEIHRCELLLQVANPFPWKAYFSKFAQALCCRFITIFDQKP